MRRLLIAIAACSAALAAAGFLLAWSGLVPIGASSGHWPITSWFLHFAMRQSVATHAMGVETPPLDDPALLERGAGHYALGCAPCHGAPDGQAALVVRQMTPPPPYLPPRIPRWRPQELFWIVKHGIKFTGMPAWVAQQREDEVWAVVAFLRQLPDMAPEQYWRLAGSDTAAAGSERSRLRALDDRLADSLAVCARCHGRDGGGRGIGAFPRLNRQSEDYLLSSLRAYARGERFSGIMQPVAASLDEDTMRRLARHFASVEPVAESAPPQTESAATLARGEAIAKLGVPRRGVPPCVACHGPTETPRSAFYPVLAGQYADYLALQLALFSQGRRGGTPYAHIMRTVADRLTVEQQRQVAAYYASLRPEHRAHPDPSARQK